VTGDIPKMVRCKNCNDLGSVQLRLCRGRFASIPLGKAVTYFGGEWHVIIEFKSYICPMCAGKGATRSVRTSTPEEAQDMVDNLPGVGELVEDWTDH
jgi:hypothetical protein